jgi:hypothetical protein
MRDGFLRQALAKTNLATPYVAEARAFAAALTQFSDPSNLADITDPILRNALVAASGFSDKARAKFSEAELTQALRDVLERFAGEENWREELVYRFLLTRGDTLGGSMRNRTGAEGVNALSEAVQAALIARVETATILRAGRGATKITGIEWRGRVLVFDRTPRFIGKNIDVILLNTVAPFAPESVRMEERAAYLAAGELKGGADPAGADEHWKTARSAFERIREKFPATSGGPPPLFFAGAAVEQGMATEIFAELTTGRLRHAANLTKPEQLSDLAAWLVSL